MDIHLRAHVAKEGSRIIMKDDVISRQAAIEALARMMPRSYTPDGSHPADEEIFRAQEVFADCIEALEILPSAQPEILACGEGELNVPDTNVGDMISRQAAIDALDVLCQEHRYKIPGKRETYSQYNEAWQDALDRAEGAIFNLPTVQPDHNADVSKKVDVDDCISRRAAKKKLEQNLAYMRAFGVDRCLGLIDEIPAVEPESKWISCDLISRQDAIKEVSKYVHGVDMIIGNGTLSMAGCRDTAEEILEGLPSMESEPKWIPCSERLPEYNESVLTWDGYVFCIEKRIPYIRDDDGEPIEGDWWVCDEYDDYESECYPNLRDGAAIAWMPIPKLTVGGDAE